MPDENLHACIYHVLRYTPNLVRDEWVNIGVVMYDPGSRRARARLIEEVSELARVRKLHPGADVDLLRALGADFDAQLTEHSGDLPDYLANLNQTLSNVLQFGPQKGVLTEDLDAELDRLYRDYVEPPRRRAAPAEVASTRARIRARATEGFRRTGILSRLERHVRVEEFTVRGDPLRLDYGYRRNGTRGFAHALALSGDPAQAKVLAYTAESIRAKLAASEFVAITEAEPRPENDRHRFISALLGEKGISLLPLSRVEDFARRLAPTLH